MIATALATGCRLVSGATVEWRSDPDAEGQRIYFANHSSHFDFIVVWSALPPRLRARVRPVAARDYWSAGCVRRYLAARVFRAVLVDRRQPPGDVAGPVGPAACGAGVASARTSVEHIVRDMGDRDSLIVFPEGTRSLDATIGPFKSGLYHLAMSRPGVPLVPVLLQNLNRILPKGEYVPVPMVSRVTFGAPIRSLAGESKDAFLARSRAALLDLR